MYHVSNFGGYASRVNQYADLDGYVPEAGDHWSAMNWDAATTWTPDAWQEYVESAVRATVEAERAVAEWQREG